MPLTLPALETVEALLHSLVANLRVFESAIKARCREAAERRQLKPALIFKDLAEPRAMPVQTIVEKVQATVVEVRPAEPAVCIDRDVRWKEGSIFARGTKLDVHHAEMDMVRGDVGHLTSGDVLSQARVVADLQSLFRTRWSRHEDVEPSRWHAATAGLDRTMTLPPITEELWRSTVRSKLNQYRP